MTDNDRVLNDRIRLLKVIRKRMMFVCKVMIINGIVCAVLLQSTMLCTAKTVHIPFRSIPFFALFTRILTKIYQEIPCLTPFILPFTPLIFAF